MGDWPALGHRVRGWWRPGLSVGQLPGKPLSVYNGDRRGTGRVVSPGHSSHAGFTPVPGQPGSINLQDIQGLLTLHLTNDSSGHSKKIHNFLGNAGGRSGAACSALGPESVCAEHGPGEPAWPPLSPRGLAQLLSPITAPVNPLKESDSRYKKREGGCAAERTAPMGTRGGPEVPRLHISFWNLPGQNPSCYPSVTPACPSCVP